MSNYNQFSLERADYPEQAGVSSREIAELIKDFADNGVEVHSLMILRGEKVAYETWAAPYSPDIPHMMYSVSKSFTSTAIGFAINEGLLTLDTKLIDIFPEFRPEKTDENLEKLNIHHLLSMQSGKSVSLMANKGKNKWIEDYFDAPWKFTPGDGHWEYISENQYMLCAALVRVTGMSVTEFLTPRLFEPLGIEVPFWEHDKNGVEAGGWGLFLKTEDLAKFTCCYHQKGMFRGKQVIPAEWVELATKSQADNSPFNNNADGQCGYGYCFWRCAGVEGYRADGMFSQYGIVDENSDASFIITAGAIETQKTRDCIWRHFPKCLIEPNSEPTPRNLPQLAPLDDVLEATPRSPLESWIEGRRIEMQNNIVLAKAGFPLSMLPLPVVYMSGDRAGNLNNLVFHFDKNSCSLTWEEGKEKNTIYCGMDGKLRYAPMTLAGIRFTAAASAAWVDKNHLTVHVRPVEAVCMRILDFIFEEDKVTLIPTSKMSSKEMLENVTDTVLATMPSLLHRPGEAAFKTLPQIVDAPNKGKFVES